MNSKFNYFLKNAKELYETFNIVPLLYGSLGLEVLTNTDLNSADIDILIPEIYIEGKEWKNFKNYLEENGYILIDEEVQKSNDNKIKEVLTSDLESIENLKEFAGIDIMYINKYNSDNIYYLLLSLDQYLKVYKKSSQDGYRMNKKEKKDNEKINFIVKCLNNSV